MSPAPVTWRVLARRGWLLALGIAVGVGAALAASGIAVSATASFSVRTIEPVQTPFETEQLARTYARLIPQDPGVAAAVGRATGLSPSEVRGALSIVAQPETSILFARFTASSRGTAEAGLRALSRALRTASDSAGSRLGKTVVRVSPPVISGGFSRRKAIALGGLAGFAIAFALILTLERRRPRIDRLQDLAELLPVPVSQVSGRAVGGVSGGAGSSSGGAGFGGLAHVHSVRDVSAFPGGPFAASMAPALNQGVEPRFAAVEPRSLVVERGAALAEVEEAWKETVAGGSSVVGAFLVNRGFSPHRSEGSAGVPEPG